MALRWNLLIGITDTNRSITKIFISFTTKIQGDNIMIEFNGYLTGISEKFFFKKAVIYVQRAFA